MAVTKAEAENKVAREKCEALPSATQGSCKDAADADLKAAKARAAKDRDDAKTSAQSMRH